MFAKPDSSLFWDDKRVFRAGLRGLTHPKPFFVRTGRAKPRILEIVEKLSRGKFRGRRVEAWHPLKIEGCLTEFPWETVQGLAPPEAV